MTTDLRRRVVPLVREAGALARGLIRRAAVLGDKGGGDFVTEADLRVERLILDALRSWFPAHGFISEEAGASDAGREYVWVLDPIDGTRHYVRGNPLYAVSLALVRAGTPVLGVVYLPETDQCFAARAGHGATLDGDPLRPARAVSLDEAMGCAEIPSRNAPAGVRERAAERMGRLMHTLRRVRILGVSSIGLCMTAAGQFDVYVNLGSNWQPHDVAAARVILRETGAVYHQRGQCLLAGPPALCDALLPLIDAGDTPSGEPPGR